MFSEIGCYVHRSGPLVKFIVVRLEIGNYMGCKISGLV